MSKIQLLKSIGHPIDGFTVTVTEKNFHLIDESIVDLAKEIGVKDMAMDFDLVRSIRITTQSCVEKILLLPRYSPTSRRAGSVSLLPGWLGRLRF